MDAGGSRQLELFDEPVRLHPEQLRGFLASGSSKPVHLAITRNRVSMATIQFEPDGSVKLRLHEAFLGAPPTILEALRTYIRSRRTAAWQKIEEYALTIPAGQPTHARKLKLKTKGRFHDLRAICEQVNLAHFRGRVDCRIGWGRAPGRRRQGRRSRSVCFGTYHQDENVVRINPRLDTAAVPKEFVEYVVFHEMLHAAVPPVLKKGRLVHHTAQFRIMEKRYPDINRMKRLATHLAAELD